MDRVKSRKKKSLKLCLYGRAQTCLNYFSTQSLIWLDVKIALMCQRNWRDISSECVLKTWTHVNSIYHKGICTYSQMNKFNTLLKRFREKRNNPTLKLDTALHEFLFFSLVANILFASVLLLTFPCWHFLPEFSSLSAHVLFFATLKPRCWFPL